MIRKLKKNYVFWNYSFSVLKKVNKKCLKILYVFTIKLITRYTKSKRVDMLRSRKKIYDPAQRDQKTFVENLLWPRNFCVEWYVYSFRCIEKIKFWSYYPRNITFSKIAIRYWNIIIVWKLISYFFFFSCSVCNTRFL